MGWCAGRMALHAVAVMRLVTYLPVAQVINAWACRLVGAILRGVGVLGSTSAAATAGQEAYGNAGDDEPGKNYFMWSDHFCFSVFPEFLLL